MAALPVEILLGIYLGILTGVIPGLAAWGLGFGFKYFTGVTIPGFAVVVLGVALAGVSGGLLALADPTITRSTNGPRLITAILVVTAISLYAHAQGDQMGTHLPRRLTLSRLREQPLSRDVVELLGGRDEVRIRPVGEVADLEGYPPLSDELRAELGETEYTFPANLPIAELETRYAERLRTGFDLGDVSVAIDERGRATVAAAPPISGLSKRVPGGKRAVSVEALLPTGLARGDEVTVATAETRVSGTVLSARSSDGTVDHPRSDGATPDAEDAPDGETESVDRAVRAPTTTGGEGRVTVAVGHGDAEPLIRAERARVTVEARGTRLEYELVSLLRRTGHRFSRLTVAAGGALDGVTLGAADVRNTYGVAVLAVRRPTGWQFVAAETQQLAAGDELFAAGPREALAAFEEAVA